MWVGHVGALGYAVFGMAGLRSLRGWCASTESVDGHSWCNPGKGIQFMKKLPAPSKQVSFWARLGDL